MVANAMRAGDRPHLARVSVATFLDNLGRIALHTTCPW
jgi:hypothetical protein